MCKIVNHLPYSKCALPFCLFTHLLPSYGPKSEIFHFIWISISYQMWICFSLIRYYWLTGLIWCCWIMSVIVFPISELIANSLHNEPHSSHTSRMNLCANCSCNHSYVNCCIELHSTIWVRIVSILQKNTQTLKRRQTDEHMNESASVLFSITQTNVLLSPPHMLV